MLLRKIDSPSPRYATTNQLPTHVSQVSSRHNCHRPSLPFSVPIKWYWYRTNPAAQYRSHRRTLYGVDRCCKRNNLSPVLSAETARIKEAGRCEKRDVKREEAGVREMRGDRGTVSYEKSEDG